MLTKLYEKVSQENAKNGGVYLLNSDQERIKTLELSAPESTTISGKIEANGKIIYQEKI